MLKQNKSNWAQETVFIRDEAGNVLAEFDRDIVANGVQWNFRRYNYHLFGKMVSAEGLLDDNDNNGIYEWGKRYYFHDHLGSIRGIIDGQGHCLQAIEYWPYGEELTSSTYNEDSYRYTGHERDYDINMDYMRARHYKYMIGRFQTPDPVNGSISNPQSWNLYSYVENDPMNYIDPYGLFEVQIEAGRPLNLEYAIKDINAFEMYQDMQLLFMFQRNEIEYYLTQGVRAREAGSIIICSEDGCNEIVFLQVPSSKVSYLGTNRLLNNFSTSLSSRLSLHNIKENILFYLKPDKKYKECQIQYLMCLAGELLPFNPYSSSTYVSQALKEISEDYEDKAFDYFIKNLYRLKQPQKSKYVWGPAKMAKTFGKLSLLYTVGSPAYNCIKKEIQCISK